MNLQAQFVSNVVPNYLFIRKLNDVINVITYNVINFRNKIMQNRDLNKIKRFFTLYLSTRRTN